MSFLYNFSVKVSALILQNFVIAYLTLRLTMAVYGIKGQYLFPMSAIFACFDIFLPYFHLPGAAYFVEKMVVWVLVVSLCFKYRRLPAFFKLYGTCVITYFLFVGINGFLLEVFGGSLPFVYLPLFVVLYFVLLAMLKGVKRRKGTLAKCVDVELFYNGKSVLCKGLVDTGNLAVDPITNTPICFISFEVAKELKESITLADILTKKIDETDFNLGHFVGISSIGSGERAFAFQIDKIKIDNREIYKPIVALTLQKFTNFDIILSSNLCEEGV